MPYVLAPTPWQQFIDPNGIPYAGGKLFTYLAGTTNPVVTFKDAVGTPNTNPIILDAAGQCSIYITTDNTQYKYVLTDVNGVPVRTQDNISLSFPEGSPPVPNLNADLLDGLNSTDFVLMAQPVGAAVIKNLNADFLDGKTATDFVSSTQADGAAVIHNLNADLLDGLDSIRFYRSVITNYNTGDQGNFSPVDSNNSNIKYLLGQDMYLRLGPGLVPGTETLSIRITGFPVGLYGQRITVKNFGPNFCELAHMTGADPQLSNFITSGPTYLLPGGFAEYVYDPSGPKNVWTLLAHEQGDYIKIPYNASNYVVGKGDGTPVGSWTRYQSGTHPNDLHDYYVTGRNVTVRLSINQSTIAGTTTQSQYLWIGGFPFQVHGAIYRPGTAFIGTVGRWEGVLLSGAGYFINVVRQDMSQWPANNNQYLQAQLNFQVI